MTETLVIRRTYLGGSEEQTFEEFIRSTIQDRQAACEVAERMLARPDEAYEWNADEPEFYETFEIIDAVALRAAVEAGQRQ